ncbi:MAG: UDP-N-acetylmuramoyl-tripeptide--D-alanyl-D-alanine ligase, partial [Dehalococcoidia bacterium]|nr:UDP-N-acetylmuramoyl-tripeptide--D-alanyl-D-alanine ligase [Dehalococcoidia bacterium]
GDMLELGNFADAAHQAIGRLATQLGIDTVLAVGQFAEQVALGVGDEPGRVRTFRTVAELLEALPGLLRAGDRVLVKGSRKMNLEQVTEFLVRRDREDL